MSVFRPAFVELGQAAFEAAKELGRAFEEALVEAAKVPALPPKLEEYKIRGVWLGLDDLLPTIREIGKQHGWEPIRWLRHSADRTTSLYVKTSCKHLGEFVFEDEFFAYHTDWRGAIDRLLKILETPPQTRCKCGVPQGLGPAGAPK